MPNLSTTPEKTHMGPHKTRPLLCCQKPGYLQCLVVFSGSQRPQPKQEKYQSSVNTTKENKQLSNTSPVLQPTAVLKQTTLFSQTPRTTSQIPFVLLVPPDLGSTKASTPLRLNHTPLACYSLSYHSDYSYFFLHLLHSPPSILRNSHSYLQNSVFLSSTRRNNNC